MYIIQGQKIKGNEFRWEYKDEDLKIAEFEFDITKCVSNYMVLAKEAGGSYNQIDLYYKK